MNFNEALIKLGFSPIEATVYITLCKHGSLTGYEVAKLCGVSRSNVYAALYSLQEKGKCYVLEDEATKYIPITKDELIHLAHQEYSELITTLDHHYPEGITVSEPYITIKGFEQVLHKIKYAIVNCESHLYLLAPARFITLFKDELEAISSSKRVTILCDQPIHVNAATLFCRKKTPDGFHMIIDTKAVITGELSDTVSQCLYTTNLSLVRLMRESFITELDMIHFCQDNHSSLTHSLY